MKIHTALLAAMTMSGSILGAGDCLAESSSEWQPTVTRLNGGEVTLPARRLGDLLVVEVEIDGKGPYAFLVDTGTAATVVSPAVASQLPPRARRRPVYTRDSGGRERRVGQEVVVPRLVLGGAEFRNFRAMEIELSELEAATGFRIDGLLGFSLFSQCLLTIDFHAGQLRLASGRLDHPDGQEVLPLKIVNGAPQVTLLVGDAQVPVVIDSGSVEPVTIPAAAAPRLASGPAPGPLMAGLTGRHRSQVGRLAEPLRLGRTSFTGAIVFLRDAPAAVGVPLLKPFAVTFDAASQAARFSRQNGEPIALQSPRTIGAGFQRRGDGWEVVDVIPGGAAAAAGLQLGDIVVAVNGRKVSAVDYGGWLNVLNRETQVTLDLRRGKEKINVSLPVSDLVPDS